jgi:hypothetical protein
VVARRNLLSYPSDELFRRAGTERLLVARIRRRNSWLSVGEYRQLHLSSEQLAFLRSSNGRLLVVAVNMADGEREISFDPGVADSGRLTSCFDPTITVAAAGRGFSLTLPAFGAQILSSV